MIDRRNKSRFPECQINVWDMSEKKAIGPEINFLDYRLNVKIGGVKQNRNIRHGLFVSRKSCFCWRPGGEWGAGGV